MSEKCCNLVTQSCTGHVLTFEASVELRSKEFDCQCSVIVNWILLGLMFVYQHQELFLTCISRCLRETLCDVVGTWRRKVVDAAALCSGRGEDDDVPHLVW
ncbi:hypothetical protein QQ045_032106 [Rhodiola kirilowii]